MTELLTPPGLIKAVEARFGVTIGFDLACTVDNCVASIVKHIPVNANCEPDPNGEHFVEGRRKSGYFHDLGVDALQQDWSTIDHPVAWLYPPEGHSAMAWMVKVQAAKNLRVFVLARMHEHWWQLGLCAQYALFPNINGKRYLLIDSGSPPTVGQPEHWSWYLHGIRPRTGEDGGPG